VVDAIKFPSIADGLDSHGAARRGGDENAGNARIGDVLPIVIDIVAVHVRYGIPRDESPIVLGLMVDVLHNMRPKVGHLIRGIAYEKADELAPHREKLNLT